MTPEFKAYRRFYTVSHFLIGLFFRLVTEGRENIQKGAAMVCANHSSWLDPFLVAFAFGRDNHVRMMGKAELFRKPLVGAYIRRIGMFPVDRGNNDVQAIKTTLRLLKSGEKVLIFPEGTRVSKDDEVSAKSGAVRMAHRAGVPVYPVYIPRKKKLFSRLTVVVGAPFTPEFQSPKPSGADYLAAADDIMERVKALRPAGDIR